jgi:hypothetical protein
VTRKEFFVKLSAAVKSAAPEHAGTLPGDGYTVMLIVADDHGGFSVMSNVNDIGKRLLLEHVLHSYECGGTEREPSKVS